MHRPTADYYSGKKYVCENYLYSRYFKRADVTYVKCDFDGCHATAKLDGNLLIAMKLHTMHGNMQEEIDRLVLL